MDIHKLSFRNSQAPTLLLPISLNSPCPASRKERPLQITVTSKVHCKACFNVDLPTFSASREPAAAAAAPLLSTSQGADMKQRPPKPELKRWNSLCAMLASAALDMVETALNHELEKRGPSLPNTADPAVQLAGNFFPVPENAVRHALPIEGTIPEGLEGVYVRNGANPQYMPEGGHHLFDGDGMLHAIRIEQGTASYANRFVRTHRYLEEERLGRPIFPKAIGELHGHGGIARLLLFYARALFGVVKAGQGMGTANAGVVFFNGVLLAMSEDDLPYAVHIRSDGDLETHGKYDFNGQLGSSMIAHPKVDMESGELFALSYDVLRKPYLRCFKISKDGKKEADIAIHGIVEPTMTHDFAITRRFVIIPDQQVVFKLREMMRGGSPVVYDDTKPPRFGILRRDAVDDRGMKWVDVPDCFCFHLWNAWEEEGSDEVVVIGSCMTPPDAIFNESRGALRSVLTEIRLDLRTLTSSRRAICPSLNLEAGQVNRKLLGRKTQYAFLAIAQPWPKVSGIAKINLLAPPIPNTRNPHPHPHDKSPPLNKHTTLHTHIDSHIPVSMAPPRRNSTGYATIHTQIDQKIPPSINPVSNFTHAYQHTKTDEKSVTIADPVINPIHGGIKTLMNEKLPITSNITDIAAAANACDSCPAAPPDMDNNNIVASFLYPPHCFGGEPMFVPRSLDPSTPEDDGYVLTFMHNEATRESELLILDASSPSLQQLASIKIPSRVPYGFHGTFITPQELERQTPSLS